MSKQTKYPMTNNLGKLKPNQSDLIYTNLFLPRKPDEYYLPAPDDGSWHHQAELDQQEQEQEYGIY